MSLKQKVDSGDVIGILNSLEEDKIIKGVHYTDSGFRRKNKDGFWGTNQKPENVINYIKEKYPISMGKHEVKTNQKYVHKHYIELKNKYNNSLEIGFSDK